MPTLNFEAAKQVADTVPGVIPNCVVVTKHAVFVATTAPMPNKWVCANCLTVNPMGKPLQPHHCLNCKAVLTP